MLPSLLWVLDKHFIPLRVGQYSKALEFMFKAKGGKKKIVLSINHPFFIFIFLLFSFGSWGDWIGIVM